MVNFGKAVLNFNFFKAEPLDVNMTIVYAYEYMKIYMYILKIYLFFMRFCR